MLLLDKLAHHFDSLRWAVAVVPADKVDLAAVDAALVIDHGEIGTLRPAENAQGRSRAACDVPKSAYSSGWLLWVGSQIDDPPCLACRALYLARFSDRDLHT
jgi:hypothetical protein